MSEDSLLAARIDRALAARERLRGRSKTDVATALAAAAGSWMRDGVLHVELATRAGLSRPMVAEVLPLVAAALDAPAMTELAGRELGARAGESPALIVHVLASNIPALALPAIAAGCLVGSVVVIKSGRADPLSAPAFQRALATVDVELAATVVPVYWPGGQHPSAQTTAFRKADVVVASGSDPTLDAISPRVVRRFLGFGTRYSVAVVGGDAKSYAAAVARDVALYDQRGCLSAQAVYVAGDAAEFAEALSAALGRVAERLPPGWASVQERSEGASTRANAEWEGASVLTGPWGTVVLHDRPGFEPGGGRRTVRVYPLADPSDLASVLPAGRIECVGIGGVTVDPETLRLQGVARICPVGRMQRPPLSWPRGQRAPLRALLGAETGPLCAVES